MNLHGTLDGVTHLQTTLLLKFVLMVIEKCIFWIQIICQTFFSKSKRTTRACINQPIFANHDQGIQVVTLINNTLAMEKIHLVSIWLLGIPRLCRAKKPTCGYWHSCFFHQAKGSFKSSSGIITCQNKDNSDFNKLSSTSSLNVKAPNKNSSSTCVCGGGVFASLGLRLLNTTTNMGIKIFESYSFTIT